MKILMVSIPSLHFFRWTSQLQESGHEVYWFDITGMSQSAERIDWVKQKVAWKLRLDFPGRFFIKSKFPRIYSWLQSINERDTAKVFEEYLNEIKPDVVHSFAMQISCLPILNVMQNNSEIKWIYSSWGSDMFYSNQMRIDETEMKTALKRIDYLITDCFRDYKIATEKGYINQYLGVFPGNGGVDFNEGLIIPYQLRKTILVKAYNDAIGKGINIIKAFTLDLLPLLADYNIVVFGADEEVRNYINNNEVFNELKYKVFLKNNFIDNQDLLKIMGESLIYIGNSISDGLPNALIEAMGMGAFPIQSNPGNVSEELIKNKSNGLLIMNPLDPDEICNHIKEILLNKEVLKKAFSYNTTFIKQKYDRELNKRLISKLYENVFEKNIE